MDLGVPLQKSLAVEFLIALVAWKDKVWVVSLKVVEEEWTRGEDHFRRKTVKTLQSRKAQVTLHHFQGDTFLSTRPTFVLNFLYNWLFLGILCRLLSLHRKGLLFLFWLELNLFSLFCGRGEDEGVKW